MLKNNGSGWSGVWQGVLPWFLFFVVVGAGFVGAREVSASALGDEVKVRIEERRAQIEADRAQRDQEREAARAEREAELATKKAERESARQQRANGCSISSSLSLAKPSYTWHNGTLRVVPTVDINIRSHGDSSAPGFTAVLDYKGSSEYESDDVSVPSGISFDGQKTVFTGTCGSDFSFKGYQLPPVDLSGIITSLVGNNQELEGTVHLNAILSGAGSADTEAKKVEFTLKNLSNIRFGSWRTDR